MIVRAKKHYFQWEKKKFFGGGGGEGGGGGLHPGTNHVLTCLRLLHFKNRLIEACESITNVD